MRLGDGGFAGVIYSLYDGTLHFALFLLFFKCPNNILFLVIRDQWCLLNRDEGHNTFIELLETCKNVTT